MFPAKIAVCFTTLCFYSFFNLVFIREVYGEDTTSSPANCLTCATCQCPPAGGYPLYTPPPPSQTAEYPPPPPPQQPSHQSKCPPAQYPQYPTPPGQYPQYPSPPGFIAGGGYVPVPFNQDNLAPSSPLPILLSAVLMMLLLSFVVFS